MTPTSATGRPDRRRRGGFTLVELLAVLAVLGAAAGAVVLAAPDPRPSLRREAEAFAARLTEAREEALLSNRVVAARAGADGYGFAGFDGADWTALNEGPFRPRSWAEDTRMTGERGEREARIVFDPTGSAAPATLTLARDGREIRIVVDGAGEVRIDG